MELKNLAIKENWLLSNPSQGSMMPHQSNNTFDYIKESLGESDPNNIVLITNKYNLKDSAEILSRENFPDYFIIFRTMFGYDACFLKFDYKGVTCVAYNHGDIKSVYAKVSDLSKIVDINELVINKSNN